METYLLAHGIHTPEQSRALAKRRRIKIIQKHGGRCLICGYADPTMGDLLVVHHIVPVEKRGHGGASNLLPICRNCHAVIHELADPKFRSNGEWFAPKPFDGQVEIIMRFGYNDGQAQAIAILATEDAWFDGRCLHRYTHDEPIETAGKATPPPCTALMVTEKPPVGD